MKVPQVCVPSIHKSTSNNRFHTKRTLKEQNKNKKWHPKDEEKKEVYHLHTISFFKSNPYEASILKEIIKDYYKDEGKKPTTIEHPLACDDHYTGLTVDGIGYCGIQWKKSSEFSIY